MQIGDRFRIGSTEVVVTQPRMPCFKLGLRFGRDDIVKRFLASGHTGFYFKVITEGEVQAGDPIVLVERATNSVIVSEVTRLYARDKNDLNGLRRIAAVAPLPDDWRDYFKEQIDRTPSALIWPSSGSSRQSDAMVSSNCSVSPPIQMTNDCPRWHVHALPHSALNCGC